MSLLSAVQDSRWRIRVAGRSAARLERAAGRTREMTLPPPAPHDAGAILAFLARDSDRVTEMRRLRGELLGSGDVSRETDAQVAAQLEPAYRAGRLVLRAHWVSWVEGGARDVTDGWVAMPLVIAAAGRVATFERGPIRMVMGSDPAERDARRLELTDPELARAAVEQILDDPGARAELVRLVGDGPGAPVARAAVQALTERRLHILAKRLLQTSTKEEAEPVRRSVIRDRSDREPARAAPPPPKPPAEKKPEKHWIKIVLMRKPRSKVISYWPKGGPRPYGGEAYEGDVAGSLSDTGEADHPDVPGGAKAFTFKGFYDDVEERLRQFS